MLAGIKYYEKAKIPTLFKIITAESTDPDCRAAFASVKKSNTPFNTDSKEVLVRISSSDSAAQPADL